MNNETMLAEIRENALRQIQRNEFWFKALHVLAALLEVAGLVALLVLMQWSNRTQVIVFVAAILVYGTLGLWTSALAAKSSAAEQRILRAIQLESERNEQSSAEG
jgi:hypothetical protein